MLLNLIEHRFIVVVVNFVLGLSIQEKFASFFSLTLFVAESSLPGRLSNCKMPSELSSPAKLFPLLDDMIPVKNI